jgi:hypothetical protein
VLGTISTRRGASRRRRCRRAARLPALTVFVEL